MNLKIQIKVTNGDKIKKEIYVSSKTNNRFTCF
jgi:hypothetical protein